MKLDANILNVIGLLFGIIGGIYLAIDALAPDELIKALEDTESRKSTLTKVSFVFAMRKIYSILLITVIGFFIIRRYFIGDLTAALTFATFSYPIYITITKVANLGFEYTSRLSPARKFKESNLFLQSIKLLLIPLWFAIFTLFFLLNSALHYLMYKPIEFISTYIFAALSFRFITKAASTTKTEKEYSFRRRSFFGLMFLCIGFAYQLLATVILLFSSYHFGEKP